MHAYSKRINQIFVTEYINRNWRIMIFKFIDITQFDRKFQSLQIEDLWCFSKFLSKIRSECFSTGFNARIIVHLKHSSSSYFKLIIAFFAARIFGSEYKTNLLVVHTLRCEDRNSKLNGISDYFLVFEILPKTPKQFL